MQIFRIKKKYREFVSINLLFRECDTDHNSLERYFLTLKPTVHVQYYCAQYISKRFEIYIDAMTVLWSVLNILDIRICTVNQYIAKVS